MQVEIWLSIGGAIFSIIGYLLSRKDAQQAAQIKLLWEKHDDDAQRLQLLELDIAKHHYLKAELDPKFDKLSEDFKSGMDSLGHKFDRLSEALIQKGIGQ